jgi:hypothetical protein
MDKDTKPTAQAIGSKPGIYINGIVISNDARTIILKDGTTRVSVKHEVALDPGLMILDRFIDPKTTNDIKVVGDEVKDFPQLKKFHPIVVRAQKIKEYNNQMTASDWEIITDQ